MGILYDKDFELPFDGVEFELEYDDLDIPVESEYVRYTHTSGPMSDYGDTGEVSGVSRGVIRRWTYNVTVDESDYIKYFTDYRKKDIESITQEDINNVDEDDFTEFLTEYYAESAEENAAENWDEDDVYWLGESLKESSSDIDWAKKAWELNEIIMSMNDEEAYYGGWLYIWPDGETEEDCAYDFGDEDSYKDLESAFIHNYKEHHRDGLYTKDEKIIKNAREWDSKLGLKPIDIVE